MFRKYALPLFAIAGILFAVWMVIQGSKPVVPSSPVVVPPIPPYANKISGAGIVEASTRNIAVGSHVSGIVSEVLVKVGQKVKKGESLWTLDQRRQRAELAVKQAAVAEAEARLVRLHEAPRLEKVPPAKARVQEAEAVLNDVRQQLKIAENIKDPRAISIEELNKRHYAVEAAQARHDKAIGDLLLLEAGSWQADIKVALADLTRAKAEAEAAQVEIDLLTMKAPVEGQILQVNIRPGEFAPSNITGVPLILMGNLEKLHVRVDIDENDAWRFQSGAPAIAYVRGNPQFKTDLTFEYIETYVVPKRSLTGESTERVDTRVMQVVYSFKQINLPVYPGQLMDVYIDDITPHATQPLESIHQGQNR